MAIGGISNRTTQFPTKIFQQRNPQQAQDQSNPFPGPGFFPTAPFGAETNGGPNTKGVSSSKYLSDLKPEELSRLGGGAALETLARVQPSLTVGEAAPLLNNREALDSIAKLMESRDNLKVSDFVSTDPKGRVKIDPTTKDPEAMEFLKERPDILPSELSAMQANFTKQFQNPSMGKAASKKSIELMKQRKDLKPDDAVQLMGKMAEATGVGQKGAPGAAQGAAPQAALDMFDSASQLLVKRQDVKPEQLGELAGSVGALGSPKDKQRAERVAEGFDAATKSLEANPMRRPDEVSQMANTIGENFKGGDEKTAGFRMNAFKESSKMMGESSKVDAKSVGGFLKEAKEKDPKIKNAPPEKQAQLLAGSMDKLTAGVKSGKVPAGNLSQHFENEKADADRGKINKNQGRDQQGLTDKKEDKQSQATSENKEQKGQSDSGLRKSEESGLKRADKDEKTSADSSEEKNKKTQFNNGKSGVQDTRSNSKGENQGATGAIELGQIRRR